MKNISGIYKIENLINGKIYIGSCINLYTRYHNHISKLNRDIHPNKYLQNSYNKYGAENFNITILVRCPKEYCVKLEQWFIDNIKPQYNILKKAYSSLGYKHSVETLKKIREGRRKYIFTDQHRKAIGEAHKGIKFSVQQRENISKSLLMKPKSKTTRMNMSKAKVGKPSPRKGVKLSDEIKRKMSESAKNRKPFSIKIK